MAHGYLREYDEDPRSSDDRDRGDWRDRDDRDWRSRERGRGFMFDDDRDRSRDRDEGRGFFSRMRDDTRSWFGEDERGGSDRGAWENNRDWPQRDRGSSGYGGFQGDYRGGRQQGGFGGSNEWREGRQSFSSHPDDHYRSWRDKQMQSLDRDYADYCREREQQFHSDFDTWRSQRHGNHQPLRTGMTQTGQSKDPSGELQLTTENQSPSEPQQDPMAAATLGTTSSGRKRSEG